MSSNYPILPTNFRLPDPPHDPWAKGLTQALGRQYRIISRRLDDEMRFGTAAQRPAPNGSRRFYYASDGAPDGLGALEFDIGAWVYAFGMPLTIGNGGTGSSVQNFVDLSTDQSPIVGLKTFSGNTVADNTQLAGITIKNGVGVPYFEGIAGVGDPAGTLGPAGARLLQMYDGSAANPIADPGFGVSDSTRPSFLAQRTTSSTASNEQSFVFTVLIKGGSGERYGLFVATHLAPGATGSGDVVGFTSTTYVEAATNSSTTSYAMWPRVERTVVTRLCGIEIDVFNSSGTDAAAVDSSTTNSTIGIAITCGGGKKNSVGLTFQSSGASSAYATGIFFGANTAYQYGIDLQPLGTTPVPIRLPNAAAIAGRNAANSADLSIVGVNASDQVSIDSGAIGTTFAGGLYVNTTAPRAGFNIDCNYEGAGGRGIAVDQHTADTAASYLWFRKSRGTKASPGAVSSGDILGQFLCDGYDGTVYRSPAAIKFFADGAPVNNTSMPIGISFHSGIVGAAGNAQRLRISALGSVIVGDDAAALATGATDGFLYIPTCAGTPTGAPTAHTGTVPLVYDTTNNFLYVRNGGTWKKTTVFA